MPGGISGAGGKKAAAKRSFASGENTNSVLASETNKESANSTLCGLYKNTYGYLASEMERANDFNQLVLNQDVDLILFGGGEGGNELLPYINYENIMQTLLQKNLKKIKKIIKIS